MRRKKVIKIVRLTEKERKKFTKKFTCLRCHSFCVDTQEELDYHNEYLHGEYKVNDWLRNVTSNRNKIQESDELAVIRYNGKIYRYVHEKGLYLDGILVCKEDEDFYREVMNYISENKYVEIGVTFKVKYPTYEHLDVSQSKRLKHKIKCETCGKKVNSTMEFKESDLILCPNCGTNPLMNNKHKIYDWFNNPNYPDRKVPKGIDGNLVKVVERDMSKKLVIKRNGL